MKRPFYVGVSLLVLFEIANVYFIMPMPGNPLELLYASQEFWHSWRTFQPATIKC